MANTLETPRGGKRSRQRKRRKARRRQRKRPKPKAAGGFKAVAAAVVAVVAMPLLAFATTRFVLLPKMQHALAVSLPPPRTGRQPQTSASASG